LVRAWAIVGVAAFVWASASPARADEQTCDGQKLAREGYTLLQNRKHREALAKFQDAQRCGDEPLVLYYLAETHDKLGETAAALTYYARFLATPRPSRNEAKVARQRIGVLSRNTARLYVAVTPEGAAIAIDGKSVGRAAASAPLFLSPGSHRCEISLAGHETEERVIDVDKGDIVNLKVTLWEQLERETKRR
jgi:tetratricopeptide (TPR) repeat protein